MKKGLIFVIAVSIFGMSCTKDITRFNDQTKNATSVSGETLFSNAVKNYVDATASSNVNLNVFRFTVGHWAATTYQDEPQYNFTTRAIPDALWNRMYRGVLFNLKEAKRIIAADANLSEGDKANKLAMCDIMQVNAFYFLTTTFGNVPYTDALDLENISFPKYDDAKTIYDDLIKRMQANVASLSANEGGISAAQDIIYGGSAASWAAYGNSLLLRMAMTIADTDPAQARLVFETANAGAFASPEENAELNYKVAPPNTNPLWVDLVQSGRQDMVAGKPLLDTLKNYLEDPRLDLYFRPNNDGNQVGGVVGLKNTFANVSKPSAQMVDPTFTQVLMGYSEVEFLRAEALARTWTIPGTISEHYDNGIKASIIWWGGTSAEAEDYLANPLVAYGTAPGNWKGKIGLQKWIALYNQPMQGWIEMRRLDEPKIPLPVGATTGYPNRLRYPAAEQQLNPDNYKTASGDVGGDVVETKLWWDTN